MCLVCTFKKTQNFFKIIKFLKRYLNEKMLNAFKLKKKTKKKSFTIIH